MTQDLSGWFDDIAKKADAAINTGVDKAKQATSSVVSAGANEVKKHVKEIGYNYAVQHPNQVRAGAAGATILTCGAIAGLLVLGYIIAKET